MVKKKTSKQNIIIVVLCLLLAVSIGFGVTYSYFNTKSDDIISGDITTITMYVSLTDSTGADYNNDSNKFVIHQTGSDNEGIVPGQLLKNTVLNIKNGSPTETYAMVVYTLEVKDNNGEIDTTAMEAMDVYNPNDPTSTDPVVGDGWRKYTKTTDDGKIINCLVYLGDSDSTDTVVDGNGTGIIPASTTKTVLNSDCLKVPTTWGNNMQGRTVTLTFQAFVLQSTALSSDYPDISNSDMTTRKNAIAEAMFTECDIETLLFPTASSQGE